MDEVSDARMLFRGIVSLLVSCVIGGAARAPALPGHFSIRDSAVLPVLKLTSSASAAPFSGGFLFPMTVRWSLSTVLY